MYGAQYGGAICSILLNLPCHPPHAVTCLDGYPMTKQGRGGVALGLTVFASFVGASWGITEMIFLSPLLVRAALQFGPAEVCSLMLLGLLAGSTLARGSPIKGVAMTVLGLFLGSVGTDLETGSERYTLRHDRTRRRHRADRAGARRVRHRRVHEQRQSSRADQHQIYQCQPQRHAADQGRPETGVLPDVARHHLRQPVRAHSRHRADHRLVRCLCGGKENLQTSGKIRHRPDRGRGLPGGGDAFLGAGRFHPDHEPRHSRRRRHGALARRADDPGHRARTAAHLAASGHLLGTGRQFLDRQHHAGAVERAVDRHLGEDAGDPLPLPLPERDVLRVHRRLCRQQRLLPGRRSRGHRPVRLYPAAARFPSGADSARLRARAAVRGEFPPRHADFARRYRRLYRAADQRLLRRDVR